MNKTISVIIPCFNYAHYLPECIESVVNQSQRVDEIIIVNDKSLDNTSEVAKELIEKYPKQNIILVEKEKNGGLSSARNTGIKEATSKFIMCLDADDMLRPNAIEEHLKIADDGVIAQAGLMYFGNQVAEFRPQGATLESMLKANTVYCNSVFAKEMWEKVKYDESETMRLGLEDWLLWIEMMANGAKVVTSDYIALLYRRHGNTMTHTTTHPKWNLIIDYMSKKVYNKYGLIADFHKI